MNTETTDTQAVTTETVTDGNIKRDASMDLSAMVRAGREDTNPEPAANEHSEDAAAENAVERELSPLEKARLADKQTSGIIVDREEENNEPLRNSNDTEESRAGFAEKTSEQEEMAAKMKLIVAHRKPENQLETVEMMNEISMVSIGPDGKAIIPEGAKYIVSRERVDAYLAAQKKEPTPSESSEEDTRSPEEKEKEDMDAARAIHKENIVKILIDKTGLGANIKFDDEENKVITESTEIHLVEVEEQELQTVEFERADESIPFLQSVDTYQLSVSKTPMAFPASGFKAEMCGLSWEEFADITLDVTDESEDYLDFDKMYKRMSTVYNKMVNISIGSFENFDDFLKKFAYADLQLAIYGLLIATQPEQDSLQLRCNMEHCKKRFTASYSPRGLIDFESASISYLDHISAIKDARPEERLKLALSSPVRKIRRFKLPRCGYIVDLGLASCHDYLYQILGTIKKLRDDEVPADDTRWELTILLQALRAIIVPQKDGKNIRFTDPLQMIEIIRTTVPPEDVTILNSAFMQYTQQFNIEFSLKSIKCPHCGHVSQKIVIDPDQLVFRLFQRQRDTVVTFNNFQNF